MVTKHDPLLIHVNQESLTSGLWGVDSLKDNTQCIEILDLILSQLTTFLELLSSESFFHQLNNRYVVKQQYNPLYHCAHCNSVHGVTQINVYCCSYQLGQK